MLAQLALSFALVLATCAAAVSSASATRASALLRWRPCAWTPPVAAAPTSANMPATAPMVDGEIPSITAGPMAERATIRIGTRPDGSRYAHLGGALRTYVIATFGADGGPQVSCVDSRTEALRLVTGAGARPAAHATARKEK